MKIRNAVLGIALLASPLAAQEPGARGNVGIVLMFPNENAPSAKPVQDEIRSLKKTMQLPKGALVVTTLSWDGELGRNRIKNLGFAQKDLPCATTAQINSEDVAIGANLNRPSLNLEPKQVAYYLVAEWARRQKQHYKIPDFPYPKLSPWAPGAVAEKALDGSEMMAIPKGEFWMGSCEGEIDELPVHRQSCPAYLLAKNLVTVAQFRRFVEATHYRTDAEKEGYSWNYSDDDWQRVDGANWAKGADQTPVTHVSLADAQAYCLWAGGRLPSEAEWEKAARGVDGRRYSWGNIWEPTKLGKVAPSGCLEMSGTLREWTSTNYDVYSPSVQLKEPISGRLAVRGGSRKDSQSFCCRVTYRYNSLPEARSDILGFRLAKDASQVGSWP